MAFAKNLQNMMEKKKISNYRLAKDLAISASNVGYWLAGQKVPSVENAMKLAEYFGVTVESLMK